MKARPFAIIAVMALLISSASAFGAVSLPDKVPGIVTQIAQKDKAAIVLINSIVTGTALIPSYTVQTGGATTIVGDWETQTETLTFTEDGRFSATITATGARYSGTYETAGDVLTLYYTYPTDATVDYTYSLEGGYLTLYDAEGRAYTYNPAGGGGTDVVANAENMVIVRETGSGATMLTEDLMTGASGTGFIITPDGYIITNAHVVLAAESPNQMLYDELAYQLQGQLYNEFSKYYNIPQQDRDQVTQILTSKLLDYFLANGQITDVNVNYYVLNGIASPGEDIKVKSWPAVVKKQGTVYEKIAGETTWGRDIAILKVERASLPTVRLGDSGKVEVGDSIYVIGYPGKARDPIFKPESLLEPTVTRGVVSAKKALRTGIETIQTDASMLPGNSGGPAYNENGEVIGIATFGATEGAGVNFLLPINLAKEFMNEINVQNRHGPLDADYADGLNAFWNRNCDVAIAKMKSVLSLYPGHPYAQDYITECERALRAGEISKPSDLTLVALVIIAVAVAVGGVVLFFKKEKITITPKKKK